MEKNNNYQTSNNQQLQLGLKGIKQAVQGELDDALYYNYIISKAPTDEEKVIISAIKEEELRHSKQFEGIYRNFTGMGVKTSVAEIFDIPYSYEEGLKNALLDELRDVAKYRAIRRRLPEGEYKDLLFDIITDELTHASMFNYLLTSNNRIKNSSVNESFMGRYTVGYHTNNFTLDEWAEYIIPLVNRAQLEARGNIKSEDLYRKYILAGVLLGSGMNPEEAIEQIEKWKTTGTSKLLRSLDY